MLTERIICYEILTFVESPINTGKIKDESTGTKFAVSTNVDTFLSGRAFKENIKIKIYNNFILKGGLLIYSLSNLITEFLSPPFFAIVQEDEFFGYWNSKSKSYMKKC